MQLVASVSGVMLGGVAEVVGSNLANFKAKYIYIYIFIFFFQSMHDLPLKT